MATLQYSCLENSRGTWQATINGVAELDTTERLVVMATSFKRRSCQLEELRQLPRLLYSIPLNLQQATVNPCLHWRLLHTHRQVWLSLLLSPGSWCAQDFVCAIQMFVSPVLWTFCSQITLAFKFLGSSQSLCSPQVGKSVLAHRTFVTLQELFWYYFSPVCESSALWLYNGANGNLLQKVLCHMLCLPGLL